MSLWSRIVNALRTDQVTREVDEELQSHIEAAVEHGRDPAEARRSLGPALHWREESHDVRVSAWLHSLRLDIVFGWRQILKKKAASAAAVLSLALTIGACTSAFRLIDALLLRPLPIAAPERLHVVAFEGRGADGRVSTYDSCSYPMFQQMRDAVARQADAIAVSYVGHDDLTFGSDQEIEKAYIQFVSGSMFPTFGLRPAAGRLLTANDDITPGAHPVAVITYDYWNRRFARDPRIVGRTFRMSDRVFEIVGVSEEAFTGTETGTVTDVFVPMMMKNARTLASPNNFWLRTLVELKPGVSAEPVGQKLSAVFVALQQASAKAAGDTLPGQIPRDEHLLFEPAAAGRSNLQRDYRRSLLALAVLVLLVLLIACANVANLKAAQANARAREMALRLSIGAGRWRLVQLMFVESAWLAFLATALGAGFAWWAAPFILSRINSPDNPARLVLPADWRVLAFSLLLALAVTFLFSLAPSMRASAVKPAEALKGGDNPHARRRLMHALIALQVAFCFVVHFVAGLFVASSGRLANQYMGFSAERVVNLETVSYQPQPPAYWNQVLDRLRSMPGVETAALTVWPLMSGESNVTRIAVQGGPFALKLSDVLNVSPGWFDAMRIPLLDGRDFRPADNSPAVAIVNQAFAQQYFGGTNPLGKSFELEGSGSRWSVRIIGFVPDARSRDNVRIPIRPTAYFPYQAADSQGVLRPMRRGTFVVRTASKNPLAMASILRQEVPRARPEFRVANIRTQVEIDQAPTIRERMLAMLALYFAAVALLLAGVGLYGVLDYSVQLRRREIGIRMAIGAPSATIAQQVTSAVLVMVTVGAVAGMVFGIASTRYIETLLFDVKATDWSRLVLPSATILAAALVAAIPAVVRAVRIDPVNALRSE